MKSLTVTRSSPVIALTCSTVAPWSPASASAPRTWRVPLAKRLLVPDDQILKKSLAPRYFVGVPGYARTSERDGESRAPVRLIHDGALQLGRASNACGFDDAQDDVPLELLPRLARA